MLRLFTAVPLSDHCVSSLHLLRRSLPGVRWIDRDNLHITLQFIGEVDEGLYPLIVEALGECRGEAFAYGVRGGGFFGSSRNPRVLWAGIKPNEGLKTLNRQVRQQLEPLVELESRRYSPHISLARLKQCSHQTLADLLQSTHFLDIPDQQAREFCLYSSRLGPEGSRYTVEASYPLGEQDSHHE